MPELPQDNHKQAEKLEIVQVQDRRKPSTVLTIVARNSVISRNSQALLPQYLKIPFIAQKRILTLPLSRFYRLSLPHFFRLICCLCLSLSASLYANQALAQDKIQLPQLGSSSASLVSSQQERALGQHWLRVFRAQAPILDDSLSYYYTYNLIRRLAYYSEISDKRFDLLLVNNPSFNAFAVPGNVIGINTGLFHYADSEDELASVIAHELGHLSQHHYARTLENQKDDSWKNIAAILGSILVMATAGGEEGIAALTAAQAAAIGRSLQYSRVHEQEADRVGIRTMANAGMNPAAAAFMFQKLLVHSRYRKDIQQFDFLLTHPLTESRVTDAFNQARQFSSQDDVDSFHFHLIKNRLYALQHRPRESIKTFQQQKETQKFPSASDYGLALAYLRDQQFTKAKPIIDKLYQNSPHEVIYIHLLIEYLDKTGQHEKAISTAQKHLSLHPNNLPLTKLLGKISLKSQPAIGAKALQTMINSNEYNITPDIWYLISELYGKAGNTIKVHLSRAEYFASIAAYIQAIKHLKLAEPLLKAENNTQELVRLQLRVEQLSKLEEQSPF